MWLYTLVSKDQKQNLQVRKWKMEGLSSTELSKVRNFVKCIPQEIGTE